VYTIYTTPTEAPGSIHIICLSFASTTLVFFLRTDCCRHARSLFPYSCATWPRSCRGSSRRGSRSAKDQTAAPNNCRAMDHTTCTLASLRTLPERSYAWSFPKPFKSYCPLYGYYKSLLSRTHLTCTVQGKARHKPNRSLCRPGYCGVFCRPTGTYNRNVVPGCWYIPGLSPKKFLLRRLRCLWFFGVLNFSSVCTLA